ncbi:oligosaccharide flippase family protein [Bacillus infantis]|uniref:oligosaccharide flippase family protein n=1 Tax=Bacillus infantis TaxID=324767 RepID=UPI001CD26C0E|nr:oligosaccharide flippase family protein [Bacillus infantis]MCA1033485.1 oligosaccharide flippase family protein [Bacillus infantis]
MNNKAITFIKNFSYTLSSNLISMLISTIVILLVPKLIGVEEYGYWQLYLFYSSYVGFLHFGWNDGVYLRYGGKEYKELNKKLFFSQFWMLVVLQLVLGAIIIVLSTALNANDNRVFILNMTAFCMFLVNVRYMLIYILQGTNRIKEFAQITMMEKVLYCCLIILFLLVGVRQFELLIFADILGKLLSLIYATYCCREIVFKKVSNLYFDIKETFENISVGIKLMFANIASILVIGIVRFGIERTWDVSTFGKVSLTLSVSNLMMVFINSVGIIMFPVLRRTNKENLPKIYKVMRSFLVVPLLGLLVSYYPLKIALTAWLPQYAESLLYMALLFPMCVYEGKMALLINTYLKTLRKEKLMLTINLSSVILSIILTLLFTVVYENLSLTVATIVVLLAFRCVLAEILLSKLLNVSVYKDIFLESAMIILFILTGWYISSWIGIALYLVCYGFYLLIKRREIKETVINIKYLIKG